MFGPVLRGRLVTLRPPRLEEASLYASWFQDLDVTYGLKIRFVPPLEMEEAWLKDRGQDPTCVLWAVDFEGRPVGTTAIMGIHWQELRATTGTMIGDRSVWGRGIGSEAMQLRTRYAFTELPLRKLNAAYVEGNEASWKAQRKSGYREVGRQRQHTLRGGRWLDHILTEVLREEWLATQGEV